MSPAMSAAASPVASKALPKLNDMRLVSEVLTNDKPLEEAPAVSETSVRDKPPLIDLHHFADLVWAAWEGA